MEWWNIFFGYEEIHASNRLRIIVSLGSSNDLTNCLPYLIYIPLNEAETENSNTDRKNPLRL